MSLKQSERAMKQHEATGEIVPSARKRDDYFSEEMWITTALRYKTPIQRLSDISWNLIIDGAWKIAQTKRASRMSRTTLTNVLDPQMPSVDERELLVEGDEDMEE